jgi:hypothetical protein
MRQMGNGCVWGLEVGVETAVWHLGRRGRDSLDVRACGPRERAVEGGGRRLASRAHGIVTQMRATGQGADKAAPLGKEGAGQ